MNRDIIFYASIVVALVAVFLVHKELKKTKKNVSECMSFNRHIANALKPTQADPPSPEVIPTSPPKNPTPQIEETSVPSS